MQQKAQIIFEEEETLVLTQKGSHLLEFCPSCGSEVLFVTAEVLAAIGASTEREIFRLVEAGAIQFIEKSRTYVCAECFQSSNLAGVGPAEIPVVKELDE